MIKDTTFNVSDISNHEAYKRDETFDTPLPVYYTSLLAAILGAMPRHKQLELVTAIRTSPVLQPV